MNDSYNDQEEDEPMIEDVKDSAREFLKTHGEVDDTHNKTVSYEKKIYAKGSYNKSAWALGILAVCAIVGIYLLVTHTQVVDTLTAFVGRI